MKYFGFFLLVGLLVGCQYENEQDLYYAGEAADSLNSGLVAYFPLDGDFNDASGNNTVLKAIGEPGFAEGCLELPSTAVSLDGNDDFLIAFIPIPDTFSISFWLTSYIDYGYENPLQRATFFDYSNKEVYAYIDGISGATKVHCGIKAKPIVEEEVEGLKDNWCHMYITIANEIEIYINGSLRKIKPFADTLHYWSDIIYFGRASYDNEINRTFFSGKLDEIRIYNRKLNSVEIMELSTK